MSVADARAIPARARGARFAYAALLTLIAPAYLLRLWWRGRAEPLYRTGIGERFGFYSDLPSTGSVWVHAVSLGETRAAAALVDALRALRPDLTLLLTHGTATGREAGKALLRPGDRQVWLPYDTPRVVRRFYAHFRPKVGVLMETEVWPNLLFAAQACGVPMVLANARLSPRSERKGLQLAALLRPAVETFALVLAQTDDDARRLGASGARDVVVSGNLKFDMTPDADQLAVGHAWRAAIGRGSIEGAASNGATTERATPDGGTVGRDIVLAAVTREGEEAPLLAAWARQPAPRPLLLIVPRHPQRFDEVAALVRAAGFTLARRSDWREAPPVEALRADVWLGDSMGEMALYYALAQVALLGGSFAPLGGQNLIEAAACGCPVVMGPHTFNFAQAAELSLGAGAARRVADIEAGVREALALLAPAEQSRMAAAALGFAARHRGAAARMAAQIAALIAATERALPASVPSERTRVAN